MTIDKLGAAKIAHLQKIHELKSYRNACRVIKQLEEYTFVAYHRKHKVLYLNKVGRDLIGSNSEVKKPSILDHMLYCNEAYIDLNCPIDWNREVQFELLQPRTMSDLDIKIMGSSLKVASSSKKIVADAAFNRNGYTHLVEIDNTRKMIDNQKKMEAYRELFNITKDKTLMLLIYTTTNDRKQKFEKMLRDYKLSGKVKTFQEITAHP